MGAGEPPGRVEVDLAEEPAEPLVEGPVVASERAGFGGRVVPEVGLGEGPVDPILAGDLLAASQKGGDLAAGERGGVLGGAGGAAVEVDRDAGVGPSVGPSDPEEPEGERPLGLVPAAPGLGDIGEPGPAVGQPVAPLGSPSEPVDGRGGSVVEAGPDGLGFQPTVLVPVERGAGGHAVAMPPLDPGVPLDSEGGDRDLIDEPGVEPVLGVERLVPAFAPLEDRVGILGIRVTSESGPSFRALAEGQEWPWSFPGSNSVGKFRGSSRRRESRMVMGRGSLGWCAARGDRRPFRERIEDPGPRLASFLPAGRDLRLMGPRGGIPTRHGPPRARLRRGSLTVVDCGTGQPLVRRTVV